jgi:hypothetical protein
LAFELAIKIVLPVYYQYNEEEQAGSDCVTLGAPHPRLRLHKPQVTSAARVNGITKINVAEFIDIFLPLLRQINISSYRLFIYEKTGLYCSTKYAKLSPLRVSE